MIVGVDQPNGRVGRDRTGRSVTIAAGVVIAAGVALGLVRYFGGVPPERGAEGALGGTAFAAPFVAAGVLAIAGLAGRPWLTAAAGIALVPMSSVSFAGVTLPLLVPAGIFLMHAVRARGRWGPAAVAQTCAAAVGVVAALVLLFVHEDPASWETATGGGSTSDIVTARESLRSLALLALVLGAAAGGPIGSWVGRHVPCWRGA
jgi:hypothetical protein